MKMAWFVCVCDHHVREEESCYSARCAYAEIEHATVQTRVNFDAVEVRALNLVVGLRAVRILQAERKVAIKPGNEMKLERC